MVIRKGMLTAAVACAMAFAGAAAAQDGSGLGQQWPNATDVSRQTGLHAYRFDQAGVAYVQVNAANGTPLLAVAAAGGVVLKLPVGDPSIVTVTTPDVAATTSGTTVYSDGVLTIQETPTGYLVAPVSAATCNDPADCTRPPAAAAKTLSTMQAAGCNDPADCTRIN